MTHRLHSLRVRGRERRARVAVLLGHLRERRERLGVRGVLDGERGVLGRAERGEEIGRRAGGVRGEAAAGGDARDRREHAHGGADSLALLGRRVRRGAVPARHGGGDERGAVAHVTSYLDTSRAQDSRPGTAKDEPRETRAAFHERASGVASERTNAREGVARRACRSIGSEDARGARRVTARGSIEVRRTRVHR